MIPFRQLKNPENYGFDRNKRFFMAKRKTQILFFFYFSYLVYSQIWLYYFLDDGHFDYSTQSLKGNRGQIVMYLSVTFSPLILLIPEHQTWHTMQDCAIALNFKSDQVKV